MKKNEEQDYSSEQKSPDPIRNILKEVKRKNIMDWGEIETAESVLERE